MGNILDMDMNKAKNVGMKPDDRARECLAYMMQITDMYRCRIIPSITIRGDGAIIGNVAVIANNEEKIGGK